LRTPRSEPHERITGSLVFVWRKLSLCRTGLLFRFGQIQQQNKNKKRKLEVPGKANNKFVGQILNSKSDGKMAAILNFRLAIF